MDTKGGRIALQINGRTYTARASVQIMGATVERTNAVNRNGSGYSTIAPKLARAEMTFDRNERSGIVFDDSMLLSTINATIFEEDARITHYFSGAAFAGTPTLDTETGEVSGLSIEAPRGGYSFRLE